MSIPSSPEVEAQRRLERDLCLRIIARDPSAEHVQEGTAFLLAYREATRAASTQPLLAEIERLRAEVCTAQDVATEYGMQSLAAEAEAQKLREALTRLADANPMDFSFNVAITEARKALGGS